MTEVSRVSSHSTNNVPVVFHTITPSRGMIQYEMKRLIIFQLLLEREKKSRRVFLLWRASFSIKHKMAAPRRAASQLLWIVVVVCSLNACGGNFAFPDFKSLEGLSLQVLPFSHPSRSFSVHDCYWLIN